MSTSPGGTWISNWWRRSVDVDLKIHLGDPQYPILLSRTPVPPERLNLRGRILRSDALAVAIVGSRSPTPYGRYMARLIAGDLAASGVTVISGLARGIDAQAHEAALEKGGRTLAVLGCGLDIDYPRGSGDLRKRIIASGALISEYDPGTPPLPGNFPSRNRIISGLSLGVVVVQAAERSGSLITARWALDQGREVMAVPGRADDPLSAGPIALLRDGAAPACGADDVLRSIGLEDMAKPTKDTGTRGHGPVVEALGPGPRLPEDLARATGLTLPRVLSELSKLELEGLVVRDEGGQFSLK
jgi:DNA processing protein